ncbi:BMP family lipoprotein, partial [Klebsiella pneumoniae]|uniref:BMP family lipoprotein n=1 Tax=Klebsiella pneumoniae TaxID=573 RepID=UPI00353220B9
GLRVALVTDAGQLNDNGFNELAYKGLQRAEKDLGITGRVVEAKTAADYVPNMSTLARQGYDLIIGVGFAYAESMKLVAKEFPNVKFGRVDSAVEGAANVTPLLFAEQEGSFLAGVIAAYQSKKCHVGFVGGVEIP